MCFPPSFVTWGMGQEENSGEECLCAEFTVGALSSLGSGLLRAGVALLCAQKEPHITTVYPPGGELLQSPQWPKIHHGIMLQAV